MPKVAQPLRELPTLAKRLEAGSYQNPPDLENQFLHQWMRTVALRRAIFKRKNVFATISLGIIYHSTTLSQPKSRDTVPLSLLHTLPFA
jgi:hypothetical protein